MHIMINGNYLSLDSILIIADIKDMRPAEEAKQFHLEYTNGAIVSFYQNDNCPQDGELTFKCFYFKSEKYFLQTREMILKILTDNAA